MEEKPISWEEYKQHCQACFACTNSDLEKTLHCDDCEHEMLFCVPLCPVCGDPMTYADDDYADSGIRAKVYDYFCQMCNFNLVKAEVAK